MDLMAGEPIRLGAALVAATAALFASILVFSATATLISREAIVFGR